MKDIEFVYRNEHIYLNDHSTKKQYKVCHQDTPWSNYFACNCFYVERLPDKIVLHIPIDELLNRIHGTINPSASSQNIKKLVCNETMTAEEMLRCSIDHINDVFLLKSIIRTLRLRPSFASGKDI